MWTRLGSTLRACRPAAGSAALAAAAGGLALAPLSFGPGNVAFCEGKVQQRPSDLAKPKPQTPLDIRLGLTKAEDVNYRLRWGIIGCGPISSDWCKCLKEVPGAVLEAVAARDPKKAAAFAKDHGVSRSCASYADLVADPNVDIVYIGTIMPLHKEQVLMALKAGKHVLCEKPLTENAADARELYELAEAKGVMLVEGLWTRYFPAVEHARFAVEEGIIGDVRMVQADFPELCYPVQYAALFFGAVERPSAVASAGSGDGGSGAVLRYGSRGCAVLSFPTWQCEVPEVCEIIGTKGRITLDKWGMHPARITIRLTPELCWDEPQGHTSAAQSGVPPHMEQYTYPLPEPAGLPAAGWHYVNQHGFVYQAEAIHRCLAAGLRECPQFTKADSLRIMELLDQIQKGIENPCR